MVLGCHGLVLRGVPQCSLKTALAGRRLGPLGSWCNILAFLVWGWALGFFYESHMFSLNNFCQPWYGAMDLALVAFVKLVVSLFVLPCGIFANASMASCVNFQGRVLKVLWDFVWKPWFPD